MLLLTGLLLLWGLYLWLRVRRQEKLSIYLIDHYMRINDPVPICGTPDVVWINKNGALIVGDYKSRSSGQVQESDIIQLSVYKLLLERTQHRPVGQYGYIHFKSGRRVRVNLLDQRKIIALYNNYQKIVNCDSKARRTDKSGYCRHCRYWEQC